MQNLNTSSAASTVAHSSPIAVKQSVASIAINNAAASAVSSGSPMKVASNGGASQDFKNQSIYQCSSIHESRAKNLCRKHSQR